MNPDDPTLRLPRPPPSPGGDGEGAAGATVCQPAQIEKESDHIGRYKLLEQIGEGGFGTVWMAEQSAPVLRRVALKVIKMGMDTKEVVARFEAERQALAMMDHPSIAHVFDGGVTDTGRPYFVMELVRGIPITRYCDEQKLGIPDRLKLFMQVCQAVQHAHQKGIIHRDLKPANILVTEQDGEPLPKVIDFGVAKALHQRLTEKTMFTALGQWIGTPAYMSPEQAGLGGLDIDTRSDIYSLGVLLYEVLTGRTPFSNEEFQKAGADEVLRMIREQEPPKPSTKITALPEKELGTVAGVRRAEPAKLGRSLRGELDWIVMKALDKDRKRRYETANGLAADLERYLANEAVLARPASRIYRLGKLVRRNTLAVAAGAAVAVALIAGATVSTLMFFKERASRAEAVAEKQRADDQAVIAKKAEQAASRDRDRAVAEKQRADEQAAEAKAVSDFLRTDLLRQADSRQQASGGNQADPDLTVKEALNRASRRIGQRFKEQPLVEAAIQFAIGDAYSGIGDAARAIPHLERSVELHKQHLGPEHPDTLASMSNLAVAYQYAGRLPEALPLLEETLKLMKAKLGPDHPDTLDTMNNLAVAYYAAGRPAEALPLLEETLKLAKAKLGPEHPDTLTSMNNLAAAYRAAGRPAEALPLLEETLKLAKAKLGPDHPDTLHSMNSLAVVYQTAGRLAEALPLLEETLKGKKATLGPEHPSTLTSMRNVAIVYEQNKQHSEAERVYRECLALYEQSRAQDWHRFAVAGGLGSSLLAQKKFTEAEPLLLAAYAGLKEREPQIPASERTSLRIALGRLVRLYEEQGQPDKAAEWKSKLSEFDKATAAKNPPPANPPGK